MKLHYEHPWDVTTKEARNIQQQLCSLVKVADLFNQIECLAGVDVGFEQNGAVTRAAVAVLSFPELQPVEHAIARLPTTFPYVPGLLSFREIPAVLKAFDSIEITPDLLLCDGQGIAHPRRFGIACHLGLLLDMPAIGVAKSRLIGKFEEPAKEKGNWTLLMDKEERVGAVLRSRTGVKPLFISVGHRISLETAVEYVLACTTRYRLPETTREAHRLASTSCEL